jgi:hypothetical protein
LTADHLGFLAFITGRRTRGRLLLFDIQSHPSRILKVGMRSMRSNSNRVVRMVVGLSIVGLTGRRVRGPLRRRRLRRRRRSRRGLGGIMPRMRYFSHRRHDTIFGFVAVSSNFRE